MKKAPYFSVALDPSTRVIFVVQTEGAREALVGILTASGRTVTTETIEDEQSAVHAHFRGKLVAILPANDVTGRRHAQLFAGRLAGIAEAVKVIELPGLPVSGDVCDWIAQGGTAASLAKLVQQALFWTPSQQSTACGFRSDTRARGKGAGTAAADLLVTLLSEGPRPAKEVQEAAVEAGLSFGTLRRAADRLGITRRKAGGRFGGDPRWYWSR